MTQTNPVGSIRVHIENRCASVTIDRQSHRNALTAEMWSAIPPIMRSLDANHQVQVITIRGAGGVFSSGIDIDQAVDCLIEPDSGLPSGGLLTAAEAAIKAVRKPTVAVLEGFCLGGAWMLAGACDLRLGTTSVRIGLPATELGIVYPPSGIETLVRLVGPATAKYLLLTATTISGEEALKLGLLSDAAPLPVFEVRVAQLIAGVANGSQLSTQAHKYLIDSISAVGSHRQPGKDGVLEELLRQVLIGPDFEIGKNSFRDRKTPMFRWTGEDFWGSGTAANSVGSEK